MDIEDMKNDIKVLNSIPLKKVNVEIFAEITQKVLTSDLDKMVGFKLTEGQRYMIFSRVSSRLNHFLKDLIISEYNLKGKDKKKERIDMINSLFVQGLIDEEEK